ncbi:MAG TPA: hypothetical protein PL005_13925, partial [Candidatus Hydrogenedentes bacterium]|nr:hypothetical protein [Candidatus Hydrogenedentota bacterium]
MRSFFPACCLALLCAAAFAAVGDENWGEEIVLLPPESEIQIHVFADDEEDIRVDGTGRFWALYSQGNPTGQQLATWEEGQWRPTALLGDGIIPAMLLDGPDGSLICVWNAGMVQVMGLRALHSSGQLPPQNRIQIFKDTRGQFWAHLVPDTGQARFAFPSESDPLVSVPFPNPMFSPFSTPVILPAFRDGKGRFWFPLNEFMSMQLGPCLACVLPDVALKLHPSGEDGWDSSTCWPSMVSFSPSGEVVPVNGKPSFRGSDQFYQPREARLFPLSGETFLFSDRGVMLWRRDGTGAYFTPVYPKDMEKMSQRDTRMNVNAALSREGRIWLATDAA